MLLLLVITQKISELEICAKQEKKLLDRKRGKNQKTNKQKTKTKNKNKAKN